MLSTKNIWGKKAAISALDAKCGPKEKQNATSWLVRLNSALERPSFAQCAAKIVPTLPKMDTLTLNQTVPRPRTALITTNETKILVN